MDGFPKLLAACPCKHDAYIGSSRRLHAAWECLTNQVLGRKYACGTNYSLVQIVMLLWWLCAQDLSRLGRDLRRTVLVDDTPLAFLQQPDNGIPIFNFRHNPVS